MKPMQLYNLLLENSPSQQSHLFFKVHEPIFHSHLTYYWERFSRAEQRLLHEICFDVGGCGYDGFSYTKPKHVWQSDIVYAFFGKNKIRTHQAKIHSLNQKRLDLVNQNKTNKKQRLAIA